MLSRLQAVFWGIAFAISIVLIVEHEWMGLVDAWLGFALGYTVGLLRQRYSHWR